MKRRYTLVDVRQADAVRVEHRSTAPGGETVAVRVDDVDVSGAAGVAFFEHARPFVDERVNRPLDDLFVRDWPAANACRTGRPLDQRQHFGISSGLSVVAVEIPALAGFLSEAPHLTERVGDERLAVTRLAELIQLLAHAPGDIEPGHVVHCKHAHGHAEVGERVVYLLGRGPVLDEELRLVHVWKHHAIADEPFAVADDDADFAEPFGEQHGRGERLWRRRFTANDLDQPHDVCGAEEVQPYDLVRPRCGCRYRVDIERGRVRRDDAVRPRDTIQCRHDLFLERQILEDGLDDEIDVAKAVKANLWTDRRHPLLDLLRCEASSL